LARVVGAVNCWWVDAEGALVGDNTDVGGFTAAARELLPALHGTRVAVLGAGGSARAVVAAIGAWPGARVALWSRSPDRADELAAAGLAPHVQVAADAATCVRDAALVVNTTPLGLCDGDAHPVPITRLLPAAAVLDLVYRPGETSWVRAARAAGHPASDGLRMLVEQGALAYARWFGTAPDREVMWTAARAAAAR
jgi:shikimate dehydrogenase